MERRLAAIMAADVTGYTRLMEKDEAGTHAALKAHREEFIDPTITNHKGRIVKLMGDGALVEFASAVDAVSCAVALQHGMAERNSDIPVKQQISFRIGINLGDVIIEGNDLYGEGVNLASRLEGLAEPGGICLSSKVYEEVRNRLELSYRDMGEQAVKNVAQPVRVYAVAPHSSGGSPTLSAREPLSLPDKPSIAVLPFTSMSSDPKHEFFADGITEEIITALSRVPELFVIARNSTFTYKGRAVRV